MRYTININAVKCQEWGLNLNQGALFDLLNQASSWAKPHMIDDDFYYWVSRNMVIDEIPIAYSKPDTVYRALKLFEEKGLIDYIKEGKKDLIKLTEKGKGWNLKADYPSRINSEINPNNDENSEINPKNAQNSEINPNKLGNKSEKHPKNSDLNPTDKNTNYKNTNDHNKKNTKKNESSIFKPEKPDHVSEQVWSDLLSHRKSKKTSNTQTAWKMIFKQLSLAQEKTGHTLDQIITEWLSRDWKGFKAEWYLNTQPQLQTQNSGINYANNQPANQGFNQQPATKLSTAEQYAADLQRQLDQHRQQQQQQWDY